MSMIEDITPQLFELPIIVTLESEFGRESFKDNIYVC